MKKIFRDYLNRVFNETASQDRSAREYADFVFREIMILLKHPEEHGFWSEDGYFVIRLNNIVHDPSLILVLCHTMPRQLAPDVLQSGTVGASYFRFQDGRRAIMIPCLIAERDLKYVDTRFSGAKDSFTHEFIHYLDDLRTKEQKHTPTKQQPTTDEKVWLQKYINDPHEYNAFYQQAVRSLESILNSAYSNPSSRQKALEEFLPDSFPQFIEMMYQRFFNSDLSEYASEETKKRTQRRLYGLWSDLREKYKK